MLRKTAMNLKPQLAALLQLQVLQMLVFSTYFPTRSKNKKQIYNGKHNEKTQTANKTLFKNIRELRKFC